jgi:hypothetical protein
MRIVLHFDQASFVRPHFKGDAVNTGHAYSVVAPATLGP